MCVQTLDSMLPEASARLVWLSRHLLTVLDAEFELSPEVITMVLSLSDGRECPRIESDVI